jgi:hypothetical protein
MFKETFLSAYRSLKKNKSHSLLNTIGLTLGITSCLMIFLVIRYELSFNTFHSKASRIYRVTTTMHQDGVDNLPSSAYPVGEAVKEEFPEVEKVATVYFENQGIIKANNQIYQASGITYISPSFFDVFDGTWLVGNPVQSLDAPNSAVLNETLARQYFGIGNSGELSAVVGKVIRLNNQMDFTVTGVTKDFPSNTDLPFKIMLSLSTLKPGDRRELTDWITLNWSVSHFLLLKDGVDPQKIDSRFPDFLKRHMDADEASHRTIQLQPLKEIHFDDRYGNYNNRIVTRNTILLLSLIGIFLLITACINFIKKIKRSWRAQGFGRWKSRINPEIHG